MIFQDCYGSGCSKNFDTKWRYINVDFFYITNKRVCSRGEAFKYIKVLINFFLFFLSNLYFESALRRCSGVQSGIFLHNSPGIIY